MAFLWLWCEYNLKIDYGKTPNNINGAISDIQFKIQSKLSFGTEDVTGAIEKLNKVKILYTGADGLNKSYGDMMNGGQDMAASMGISSDSPAAKFLNKDYSKMFKNTDKQNG